jgi:lysophospholipase L1-like esterase
VINPIGYGSVIVSIGDSITAGTFGDTVSSSDPSYPVTTCAGSPEASQDCRNFYQYEDYSATGVNYLRGYQLRLNDLLTACRKEPVFILNDGFPGARTAVFPPGQPPGAGNRNLLAKMAAFNDHINKLGAGQVLLLTGANDVTLRTPTAWQGDLNLVVDALQTPNPGLATWIALLPWRGDDTTFRQNTPEQPVRQGPDFFTFFQDYQSQLFADLIHPNQTGYDSMAMLWSTAPGLCTSQPIKPTIRVLLPAISKP